MTGRFDDKRAGAVKPVQRLERYLLPGLAGRSALEFEVECDGERRVSMPGWPIATEDVERIAVVLAALRIGRGEDRLVCSEHGYYSMSDDNRCPACKARFEETV